MNQTDVQAFKTPFYFSPKPALIEGISDLYLTLAAPIFAYWSLSLLFHWFDVSGWKWLEKYRIHDSAEVKTRNLATMTHVIWAVLFQQLMQSTLGYIWMPKEEHTSVNYTAGMESIARVIHPHTSRLLGDKLEPIALANLTYYTYWWVIPSAQLVFAM